MIETLTIGSLKWRHVTNPADEDFKFLKEKFHFHPLDIEDCKSVNQRPKIDIYDDYYFLILQYPNFDRQNKFIKTKEVKFFWGKDYITTALHPLLQELSMLATVGRPSSLTRPPRAAISPSSVSALRKTAIA